METAITWYLRHILNDGVSLSLLYVHVCVCACVRLCVYAYVWAGGGPCRTPSLIHLTFPVLKILIAARHPLTCIYDKAPTKPSRVSRFLRTAQDFCRRLCPVQPCPAQPSPTYCASILLRLLLGGPTPKWARPEKRNKEPREGPWAPGGEQVRLARGEEGLEPRESV